jgi:hypothetical protein
MKRTLLIVMLILALIDLTCPLARNLSGLAHAQTGGGPSASLPSTMLGTSGAGYDLTWWTVDGGGMMNVTGGAYTLGGTIGQPDAGVLSGGGFSLNGGFWVGGANQCKVYLPLVIKP